MREAGIGGVSRFLVLQLLLDPGTLCQGVSGRVCRVSTLDGNLRGLKASQKKALERTHRRRVSGRDVVSLELARHLTEISRELGRQIGVLVARSGIIKRVIVGDMVRLMIPEIGRMRGGPGRFRGAIRIRSKR